MGTSKGEQWEGRWGQVRDQRTSICSTWAAEPYYASPTSIQEQTAFLGPKFANLGQAKREGASRGTDSGKKALIKFGDISQV